MSKFTGVLAWHPEVAMSEDETNDFLSGRWVARMATIGRDGYPVVTPLWYLWDGKCLYFNIAKSRQSLKNLARNPKVSVVIDMDERPLMGMRTNFAKAVLVASLTPNMYRSEDNPSGQPPEWFEAIRGGVLGNRSEFYRFVPENPFYGYNKDGAKPSEAIIANWWRQGMMGGAKAHYDGIRAFSETDFTEDLKVIDVPTLVMHGDDDQIVPIADSAPLSAKLLKKGTLKVYEKFPHGMCTTHADVVNADLLAFIKS